MKIGILCIVFAIRDDINATSTAASAVVSPPAAAAATRTWPTCGRSSRCRMVLWMLRCR